MSDDPFARINQGVHWKAYQEKRYPTMTNLDNETLSEVVQLEVNEAKARRAGAFDEAVAFQALASAVRSGQLSLGRLYDSDRWCRVFAGPVLA